ncbi:MAG: hypothetical protein OEW75_07745 [Cyclobacteriaceae bacterium]|nr:hypothetical protein [Cyclobacteriaceae bacterium]
MRKLKVVSVLLFILFLFFDLHAQGIDRLSELKYLRNDSNFYLIRHKLVLNPNFYFFNDYNSIQGNLNNISLLPSGSYNLEFNNKHIQSSSSANLYGGYYFQKSDIDSIKNWNSQTNLFSETRFYLSGLDGFVLLKPYLKDRRNNNLFRESKSSILFFNLAVGPGFGRINYIQDETQLLYLLHDLDADGFLAKGIDDSQFYNLLGTLRNIKNERVLRTRKLTKREIKSLMESFDEQVLNGETDPTIFYTVYDNLFMYNRGLRRSGYRFGVNYEHTWNKSKRTDFGVVTSEINDSYGMINLYGETQLPLSYKSHYSGYYSINKPTEVYLYNFLTVHEYRYAPKYYMNLYGGFNLSVTSFLEQIKTRVGISFGGSYFLSYQLEAYANGSLILPFNDAMGYDPMRQELFPVTGRYGFSLGLRFRPIF